MTVIPFAGSSNGRTPASGAGYLGSNPSPAASEMLIPYPDLSLGEVVKTGGIVTVLPTSR